MRSSENTQQEKFVELPFQSFRRIMTTFPEKYKPGHELSFQAL
jgi:hypothetical protein